MRNSTFPRSGVLVLGADSIQSLLPSTIISQAEALLESHRIQDAVDLADQQRRKLQEKPVADADELEELHYVYQRIGFQCLSETLFEDAGKNLFEGELDPRVLVSYFPDLRGALFSDADHLDVFAGVAEHMPPESCIDDIIRNYSPHLPPNTRSAPPTAELRKVLGFAARDMLDVFLRKTRTRRKVEQKAPSQVDEVVDTVLAKLYAESEKTTDLYALLQEQNHVLLPEVEPVLKTTGQYSALCMIYRQRGDNDSLLEAYSKLADGEWTDEDIPDPLSEMFALLSSSRDRALSQKWGIWLTKKDPERAMKLLTAQEPRKRKDSTEDDLAMLAQIREANDSAGAQFLEHLIFQKRSTNPGLHMQFATACVDQLLEFLEDESVSKLWRAKAASYASSTLGNESLAKSWREKAPPAVPAKTDSSFLAYFASTTPESEHKRARLKAVIFFQCSSLYDAGAIRERLAPHRKVLALELAIVDGKLGNHDDALRTLVHDLRDGASAEAYCLLGGAAVPAKTAQALCEPAWTPALFGKGAGTGMMRRAPVEEGLKRELLRVLMEVYMQEGESCAGQTARLLNSQAVNLDVVDVISSVPEDWPLNVMSSFFTRSFRRTLHARQEGQIVKAISAGQNLEVADRTWEVLREQGAIVEEAVDDDADGAGEDEGFFEKDGLAEKVALQLHLQTQAVDVQPAEDVHTSDPEREHLGKEGMTLRDGDGDGGVDEAHVESR